jgi:phenylpropionate dioxygenase-like ring-hydroxylating dioxygenase large terminal subunit
MLTAEDNELLARIGPGAMMGDVFRQYWLPLLLSSELPDPDGSPLRVRVLGEDLVAFRDSSGQVGLLAANCAHRGASLFFGRNEECGLRCVYHGWKYDVTGACVDMPNEPPESNFKEKVHQRAYPCSERNGLIWTYMGPLADPPHLPALEWNMVPADQRYMSKRYEECNWAQALEGGIDSSHSSFLHSSLKLDDYDEDYHRGIQVKTADKHPRFEVVDTDYGELVAARRTADEEHYYWRITQFLMPAYTMLPPYGSQPMSSHFWLPIDDYTTMAWTITWHPTRPLNEDELDRMAKGWGLHVGLDMLQPGDPAKPGSEWKPIACAENDYLIDWEKQKKEVFSGLPWIAMQDQALQESMGPVYDRTNEHLGVADTGIIQVRRRWLQAAKLLRHRGVTPPGAANPESYQVRAAAVILPKEAVWVEAAAEHLTARQGVHLPSA